MIIRILIILFICFSSEEVLAQSDNKSDNKVNTISGKLQKMRWDMNMGAAYSFNPYLGGGMNYYAAPGFSYPLTNNISFHGGILTGFSNRSIFVPGDKGESEISYGFTSIYGSVSYQLNQNVVFYSTGIKNIGKYGPVNPLFNTSFNEISIGSSIRLGNSVTVGASIHFREYGLPLNSFSSPFFKY